MRVPMPAAGTTAHNLSVSCFFFGMEVFPLTPALSPKGGEGVRVTPLILPLPLEEKLAQAYVSRTVVRREFEGRPEARLRPAPVLHQLLKTAELEIVDVQFRSTTLNPLLQDGNPVQRALEV